MSYEISFNVSLAQKEDLCDLLFELGAGSITVENSKNEETVLRIICESESVFLKRFSELIVSVREISESDWKNKWVEHYTGGEIAPGIYVYPYDRPLENISKKNIQIQLNPRNAFGDGTHPTTALCVRLLNEYLKSIKSPVCEKIEMIDVGTGSGLLAIVAYKLGLKRIELFDYDPESVEMASENLRLNSIYNIVPIKSDIFLHDFKKKYHIITANLLTDILLKNLKKIISALTEDGIIIMSGIGDSWCHEINHVIEISGGETLRHINLDGWNAYMLKKMD